MQDIILVKACGSVYVSGGSILYKSKLDFCYRTFKEVFQVVRALAWGMSNMNNKQERCRDIRLSHTSKIF